MVKYLRELVDQLVSLKNGIIKNPAKWADHEITPEAIQLKIDQLTVKEKEVDDTKQLLAEKQAEARTLETDATKYAEKIENYAIAFHTEEPEKLAEYGIETKKEYKKKQAPTVKLTVTIEDDTDGEGFILTTVKDADAEMYEWYKGESPDAAKTDLIPVMSLFKTTKKISFVDDEIKKGVRYFYKVRPVNTKGEGPWSEAVSRVQ
ncbi:MAG: hypothetical protein NTX22_06070 [Ignavibacteriales bacterium]|nr:hypothetical protein [Ignavibacteriales bacterium]